MRKDYEWLAQADYRIARQMRLIAAQRLRIERMSHAGQDIRKAALLLDCMLIFSEKLRQHRKTIIGQIARRKLSELGHAPARRPPKPGSAAKFRRKAEADVVVYLADRRPPPAADKHA